MSSRKLVLLGYGDIAQRLARQSENHGRSILAVRRTSIETSIQTIVGDVTNSETLKPLLDGPACDILVTLTPDDYSEQGYRNSYLACAQALATVVPAKSPDSRVIFVSSTSVYGQDGGEWVDESSNCEPRSATAKVLLEAEQAIASTRLQHCNLRFSGIYGRGRTRLINSVKEGQIAPSTPVHWTNRIHADDCAGILNFLLLSDEPMPACLIGTDNQCASKRTVQNYIARLLDGESPSSLVEEEEAKAETSQPQQKGKRCSNQLLKKLGYEYQCPSYKEGFAALINSMDQGR